MPPFSIDARKAWNTGADAFIHFIESGADYYRLLVHGPGLLAACGPVQGLRALDLGCGQGYFSRLLAEQGATVTGVDLAEKLVARAQQLEAARPLGITYVAMDAAKLDARFQAESFELVTSCMAVHDMGEPLQALATAHRLLVPTGRFLFSIPHPCTNLPLRDWQRDMRGRKVALCLDRYFDSGPAITEWDMPKLRYAWQTPFHRHTLTEWSTMARRAGFVIRNLAEPRPSRALVAEHPELDDCARMPYFLVFELAKQA